MNNQTETPIARHPTNPNIMFASAITWNVGGTTGFSCGHYVTTNGGMNWFGDDTTVFNYGDPSPVIDHNGRLIISYVTSTGNIGASYSTNNGVTWSANVTFPNSNTSSDKPLSATSNGTTYTVYTNYIDGRIWESHTTNGGVSWSSVTAISTTPSPGHWHIGVDIAVQGGFLYMVWANAIIASQNSTEDSLGFARLTEGVNVANYKTNHAVNMNGIRTSDLFIGVRANGFPRIALGDGIIYATSSEKFLSPALDGADIVLMKSTDLGRNWTRTKVNQNANNSFEYHAAINVDEDGGVNIIYYSTRNTPTNDSVEVYLSRSTDEGKSFEDVKISDNKFKPIPITPIAPGFQGDYIGVTSGNRNIIPYWCENVNGLWQAVSTIITY